MPAPQPDNESERLARLIACEVLDTAPEPAFDEVARLAAQVCDAPIALVSLVDAHRQWFKARVGLDVAETPRDVSFCAHVVAAGETIEVADTHSDARFAGNPLVTAEPHIRFYAGVPLTLEGGVNVGTLCVLDRVPRTLSGPQRAALSTLARQVATELSLRRSLASTRPPPANEALAVEGRTVAGRYRVTRVIGAGGMGFVVAARDAVSGDEVAIKFLMPELRERREFVSRFVREARATLAFDGAHVARVRDVGNLANGAPFIVMELLRGEDLATRLARRGPLPVGEAVLALRQACDAVGRAHAVGILHRDLKPSNLFAAQGVGGEETIKVLDFGIAKFWRPGEAEHDLSLTDASTVLGTPSYMSPEQMRDARRLDARSEVWSLGVIAYELITGELPYSGATPVELYARILDGEAPALDAGRADVPAGLAAVVARCLNRDPSRRYDGVDALSLALAPFDPTTPAPPSPSPPARPRTPWLHWRVALVIVALVILVVAASLLPRH